MSFTALKYPDVLVSVPSNRRRLLKANSLSCIHAKSPPAFTLTGGTNWTSGFVGGAWISSSYEEGTKGDKIGVGDLGSIVSVSVVSGAVISICVDSTLFIATLPEENEVPLMEGYVGLVDDAGSPFENGKFSSQDSKPLNPSSPAFIIPGKSHRSLV